MINKNTFTHGGNILSFSKLHNIDPKDIIDLSSNINFVKPKINLDFNSLDISSYPNYNKLYTSLSKHFNIKESQLFISNGGSNIIFELFNFLKNNKKINKCTIYAPAYLEYKRACNVFNYKLTLINRFNNIYKNIQKNSLVIFVNPATPDGTLYNKKTLTKLFKIWKKANATVLIDESFLEFNYKNLALKFLTTYKKLYILKSMTKFYSSAGVRVGILISNKNNISKLKLNQPAWILSEFDINYIISAVKDKNFIKKSIKMNNKNKKFLIKLLKNNKYVKKIFKTYANFILIKLKNINSKEFQKKLLPYNIMVRDCSNFDFLDNKYVRIAIKEKNKLKLLNNIQ